MNETATSDTKGQNGDQPFRTECRGNGSVRVVGRTVCVLARVAERGFFFRAVVDPEPAPTSMYYIRYCRRNTHYECNVEEQRSSLVKAFRENAHRRFVTSLCHHKNQSYSLRTLPTGRLVLVDRWHQSLSKAKTSTFWTESWPFHQVDNAMADALFLLYSPIAYSIPNEIIPHSRRKR